MDDLKVNYEQLVLHGDVLFKQLETVELCLTAIIDYMFRYGDLTYQSTVENVLAAINKVEIEVRTTILYWRLEKALLACELKKNRNA